MIELSVSGDRGSCSADSGVRVSSDRESGATSVAGNLSDSTTDGTPTITVESGNKDIDSVSLVSSVPPPHMYQSELVFLRSFGCYLMEIHNE